MRKSKSLSLFHRMSQEVPAYKAFLKKSKFDPKCVQTQKDWQLVPTVSKANYLRAYPYRSLFWDGSLKKSHILTSTSGSTGEPFYFARSHEVDEQSAAIHERFFLNTSLSKTEPTLVMVCFGMGIWIGGVITYQAFELVAKRGYPLSIITPGINKVEIQKILQKLAPHYKQLIIAGYPPFVKDIVDECTELGILSKKHKIALLFAAEAFTENFRSYVAHKAGVRNEITDTMNIYGTADLGTMAFETPLSVFIRKQAVERPALFEALFGSIVKTPTFAQYIPSYTSFEAVNGELLITADSAMPLARYAIGDNGGVFTFAEVESIFRAHGIDLKKIARRKRVLEGNIELPFVYVYERRDLSATLYGLQVYPETIKEVLLEKSIAEVVTGRAALTTRFDDNQNQFLEINVELRRDKHADDALQERVANHIVHNLKLKNAEYRELTNFLGERAVPHVVFLPYEDQRYFRRDIKQKWVIK